MSYLRTPAPSKYTRKNSMGFADFSSTVILMDNKVFLCVGKGFIVLQYDPAIEDCGATGKPEGNKTVAMESIDQVLISETSRLVSNTKMCLANRT